MPDRTELRAAANRLQPHVRRTPVLRLEADEFGVPLALKLEFLQHSGSFKARGAFNRLLTAGSLAQGVVAASGGNHGAAVAYAAQRLGTAATIFVPAATPAAKLARIEAYGATVVRGGSQYAEALEASRVWATQHGALEVHAYDDAAVLAGQGTIGVELSAEAPDLTHVLVAVGGGGLIGGIGSWYEGQGVTVVGVEPASCPTLSEALRQGQPTPVTVGGVAADSLGARQVGALCFAMAARTGLQVTLVSDAAIRAAQAALWQRFRIATEPGGATALAPLLSGDWVPPPGARVGVVLCGANAAPESVPV